MLCAPIVIEMNETQKIKQRHRKWYNSPTIGNFFPILSKSAYTNISIYLCNLIVSIGAGNWNRERFIVGAFKHIIKIKNSCADIFNDYCENDTICAYDKYLDHIHHDRKREAIFILKCTHNINQCENAKIISHFTRHINQMRLTERRLEDSDEKEKKNARTLKTKRKLITRQTGRE